MLGVAQGNHTIMFILSSENNGDDDGGGDGDDVTVLSVKHQPLNLPVSV